MGIFSITCSKKLSKNGKRQHSGGQERVFQDAYPFPGHDYSVVIVYECRQCKRLRHGSPADEAFEISLYDVGLLHYGLGMFDLFSDWRTGKF